MLKLCKSVRGLADALMQARVDVGLPPTLEHALVAQVLKVLDVLTERAGDPKLPAGQALLVHKTIRSLSKTADRAREQAQRGKTPPGLAATPKS